MNSLVQFLVVFLGTLFACSEAQKPYQTAAVLQHNQLRARHQGTLGLVYDANLAKVAEECAAMYVKGTADVHKCPKINGKYGENYGMQGGSSFDDTLPKMVQAWHDEIKLYNFDTPSSNNYKVTGHFTQVVWKDTKRVGCGCAQDTAKNQVKCSCAYDPPGNFNTPGSYAAQVGRKL